MNLCPCLSVCPSVQENHTTSRFTFECASFSSWWMPLERPTKSTWRFDNFVNFNDAITLYDGRLSVCVAHRTFCSCVSVCVVVFLMQSAYWYIYMHLRCMFLIVFEFDNSIDKFESDVRFIMLCICTTWHVVMYKAWFEVKCNLRICDNCRCSNLQI